MSRVPSIWHDDRWSKPHFLEVNRFHFGDHRIQKPASRDTKLDPESIDRPDCQPLRKVLPQPETESRTIRAT